MDSEIIEKAVEYVKKLFRDNADGHGADHSLRVFRTAVGIAENHPDCDAEAVALAALLHDADDHKLFQTENHENARRFLTGEKLDPAAVERICGIIDSVSFSKNRDRRPESVEAMIVQDADRLDAMGAIGIARTFAYGGGHGRTTGDSVRHFYDKLLLLGDLMNTEEARKAALSRHLFMEEFLRELEDETGIGAPGFGSDPAGD